MADATAIREIVERLERAEGPNFRLEQEIMWAVRNVPERHRSDHDKPPAYTSSLDAAMTLVPEGWFWRVGHTTSYQAWAFVNRCHPDHADKGDEHSFKREHWEPKSTPALALCIAALRARLASGAQGGKDDD